MCKQIQTHNVFNNTIDSKVYDSYFLVPSAHDEKRVNALPLLNMKVTLLTSLFYYSVVNRCKNPEIYAVARSELNSWVGYLVNFISNRF